jgi:hypothetical protein
MEEWFGNLLLGWLGLAACAKGLVGSLAPPFCHSQSMWPSYVRLSMTATESYALASVVWHSDVMMASRLCAEKSASFVMVDGMESFSDETGVVGDWVLSIIGHGPGSKQTLLQAACFPATASGDRAHYSCTATVVHSSGRVLRFRLCQPAKSPFDVQLQGEVRLQ